MGKYDYLLGELKNTLTQAQSTLIVLPSSLEVDTLAAGLALYLALEQAGKAPSIVSEGPVTVGHTNLFSVGSIKKQLPSGAGGNYVISLGGVVVYDNEGKATVPALQELKWHPNGNDLDLVFHVLPGQQFNPTHITPKPAGVGGFGLTFVVGAITPAELGNLYASNSGAFQNSYLVNIDNHSSNSQFGKTNIVDPKSSSVSEIIGQLLPALGLLFSGDIATNVISGILAATSNLQAANVSADTFETISQALKSGGKRPQDQVSPTAPATSFDSAGVFNVATPTQPTQSFAPPSASNPLPWVTFTPPPGQPGPTFDFTPIGQSPIMGVQSPAASIPNPILSGQNTSVVSDSFTVPQVVGGPAESKIEFSDINSSENQPSPEETPRGEGVESSSPEPDWLTPKIFKGSNLG